MHQRYHSDLFLAFQLTLGSLQKGTDQENFLVRIIILLDFFCLQTFQPTEFMSAINVKNLQLHTNLTSSPENPLFGPENEYFIVTVQHTFI